MTRVLIIKLGALGDVVMSLPLIKQIQQHHKDAELLLLTSPAYAGLFRHWPHLDVHSFPRKGLRTAIQTLGWIRRQGADCLYDLQSNDRSGILCALSGVPLRIGNHPRFPYHLHPGEKYLGRGHIFARMLELLRAAGIDAKNEAPSLPVSKREQEKVAHWLGRHNPAGLPVTIMHAGASPQHPAKRWPHFGYLAKVLEQSGYCVVWVGTEADAELNRSLARQSGIDASNAFSLQGLSILGRTARLAITNDSGPMHVLSCSGIPVYGLFGPTDWRRHHAIGQKENVISPNLAEAAFAPSDLRDLRADTVVERLRQDGHLSSA